MPELLGLQLVPPTLLGIGEEISFGIVLSGNRNVGKAKGLAWKE